jgi:LruC domain-containing protein
MKNSFIKPLIVSLLCLGMSNCKYPIDVPIAANTQVEMDAISVPNGFNFQASTSVKYELTLLTNTNQPLVGVVVDLLNKPSDQGGVVLATTVSDRSGKVKGVVTLPTYLTSIAVRPRFVGLEQNAIVPIRSGIVAAQIGGSNGSQGLLANAREGVESSEDTLTEEGAEREPEIMATHSTQSTDATEALAFKYLGTFNADGKPNYLTLPNAAIDAELLSFVNASLPEQKAVPSYHPAYLKNTARNNIVVQEQADVWITFVAEGAGYQNTLGFYTYPTGQAPKSAAEIENITIVLPNASVNGTKGPLIPGNQVKLGRFQPGTTISFVLIANGFQGGKVTNGYHFVFSDDALNASSNPDLKRQSVLLHDATRNLFMCGFEDIRRDYSNCDHDFNDLVFYTTSNPVRAISTQNVLPIDKPIDADGDGVSDVYDEFPKDPTRAFSDPTAATGTLAFEDLWPAAGDYDLNDLVVDYKMWSVKNAQNLALDVNMEFTFRAIGGSYTNGFGIELPVPASAVSSVTGAQLSGNYITRLSTGVEASQSKAVVIVTDDVNQVLKRPSGYFVNTELNATKVAPVKVTLKVTFNTPQNLGLGLSAPYNPFLIANKQRGYEVHLPGYLPTEKANVALFNTLNDATNASRDVFFKTKNGMPFALHLPEKFDYPAEKQSVVSAYPKFFNWVTSGGTQFKDWYQNKSGYRNTEKIYK